MDDFRLAYDDHPGDGVPIVLLHGWPGDRQDYRAVVPLLEGRRVLVPDLRGFGDTTNPADVDAAADATAYGVDGQAAEVIALIEAAVGGPVVLGGYDVGSRTAQGVAKARPDLVRGAGDLAAGARGGQAHPRPGPAARVLVPGLPPAPALRAPARRQPRGGPRLPRTLLDALVRPRLRARARPARPPRRRLRPAGGVRPVDQLVPLGLGSGGQGAGRADPDPADRIAPPTTILWPEHDPLFSRDWSDKVDDWFAAADLRFVDGIGHFVPLEAPEVFAAAIREH